MVILVTGGTGFLGSVVLKYLQEKEHINTQDIRFLARNKEKAQKLVEKGFEPFYGNLADKESLKGIMKDVTVVYHNAAIVINESVSADIMSKVNFEGTVKLIEEFLNSNTTTKFNFASTFGVYGFRFPKYPVDENYPLNPENIYQKTKAQAEHFLLDKSSENGINATAYRYPLIVGPNDTLTTIRVSQGLLEGKIVYMGKATNKFSMIDARDGVRAMLKGTVNKKAKGEVYNIKSFDISQQDYFDYYADALQIERPKKRYPVWFLKLVAWFSEKTTPKDKEVLITRTRVKRYSEVRLSDDSKIRKELGFKPIHTNSKKVIKESVDWALKNNYIEK